MPATATAAKSGRTEGEPTTPAARRAAGLPPEEPDAAEAGTTGDEQDKQGQDEQAQEQPASPRAGRTVTQVPGGDQVTADNLTKEEMDTIRLLRSSRGAEIRSALDAAPVGVGTEMDPYTLVHMRGCPHPELTETYPSQRPDGRDVTVERCMTCGAQNIIDH